MRTEKQSLEAFLAGEDPEPVKNVRSVSGLDCASISSAIREYERTYTELDRAVEEALRTTTDALAKICLVGDWGTILRGPVFQERIAVATAIQKHWPELQALGAEVSGWLHSPLKMEEAIDRVERYLPLPLRVGEQNRRPLSLISKFLYWCVSDCFPIFDSNARGALGLPRDPASATWTQDPWTVYREWTRIVGIQVNAHLSCCLRTSDPVRTFDKALFIIGKP